MASAVCFALVAAVIVLGFFSARWGSVRINSIEEWALGGRRFGTLIYWFLLGGDAYTAYTFIALPALAYGAGALAFYAVPYATITYPLAYLFATRLWVIGKKRGYLTTADFVRERFDSRALEIAVAVTGLLALVPYIALQLIGMQAVLQSMGLGATNSDIFLIVSFALLAAFTFTSGLRAPAMIAVVKDVLIYITVITAIVYIPAKLGGWHNVFALAQSALHAKPKPGNLLIPPAQYFAYSSLVFGSALALFNYPHLVTSTLSAKNVDVVKRNMALLPAYTILLGLLALLGYCALAAGIHVKNTNLAVPSLFAMFFPPWFAGVAFAAIIIGALVPAAIMAIGAANLFASNIFRSFTARGQGAAALPALNAKLLALGMLGAALAIALLIKPEFAINFQLLGGAWMLQTVPAGAIGLFTRWFHRHALLWGWIAGMITSTYMGYATHYASIYTLHAGSFSLAGYIAFYALVANLLVAVVLTPVFGAAKVERGIDLTSAADYA